MALWLDPGGAGAVNLTTGRQLGVSRAYPEGTPHEYWTVWTGRSDGNLVSLREDIFDPTPRWTDHGQPHVPVGTHGVSATGWTSSGSTYERAYTVAGNVVAEQAFQNRNFQWAAPYGLAGKFLAGPFAVARRFTGTHEPVVFVILKHTESAQTGDLYAVTIPNGVATFRQLTSSNDFSLSLPIAASNTTTGSVVRVFASRTNGTVFTARWSGGAWTGVSLGAPGGVSVCGTTAAAEGNTGAPAGYRVYVFCTKTGGTEAVVRYRYAPTSDGIAGWSAWSSLTIPGGNGNALNSGYALAATSRQDATGATIEVGVLTTTNKLYLARHAAGGAAIAAPQGLGDDGEYSARFGGLGLTPANPAGASAGYSYLHYLGPIAGAGRLYRRTSDGESSDSESWRWGNHGDSLGWGAIETTTSNTENSTSFWRGRAANVVLVTSPSSAPAQAQSWLHWSTDDGETWPVSTALPVVDSTPLDPNFAEDYVSDPTVAFTDQGRAWISVLGIDRVGAGGCAAGMRGTSASYLTTTDGVNFTSGALAWKAAVGGPPQIDHPWVDVYQDPAGADRVHFAWGDAGNLMYASSTNGVFTPVMLNDPSQQGTPPITSAGIPYVTVGAEGATYVAWDDGICRINAGFTDCEGIKTFPGDWDLEELNSHPPGMPNNNGRLALGTTSNYIFVVGMQSWVASPSDPNIVYYAFQRDEGTEQNPAGIVDVHFAVFTYDPDSNEFSFSAPIAPYTDDGFQQFSPEITVTRDITTNETVYLSWYDMRDPGQGNCAQANRCYRAKRALLFYPYASFRPQIESVPFDAASSLADGTLLPSNCNNPDAANFRFLGDFHRVRGDRLHSFHSVIGAPAPGGQDGVGLMVRGWVSRGFTSWLQ